MNISQFAKAMIFLAAVSSHACSEFSEDSIAAASVHYSPEQLSADQQKLGELAREQKYISFCFEDEPTVGFMSNHFLPENGVTIWGRKFRCSEGAYQAAKFLDHADLVDQYCPLNGEECVKLKSEMEEKGLRRTDWFKINEEIMRQVLFAKFTQNEELKSLLLSTGDAYLVEHSLDDGFWGDKLDQDAIPGENKLGAILMDLRGSLGGPGNTPAPAQYYEMVQRERQQQ